MKVLAILLLLTLQASADQPDCERLRAYVAQHGKIVAMAKALSHGYTIKEISRIRKACGI